MLLYKNESTARIQNYIRMAKDEFRTFHPRFITLQIEVRHSVSSICGAICNNKTWSFGSTSTTSLLTINSHSTYTTYDLYIFRKSLQCRSLFERRLRRAFTLFAPAIYKFLPFPPHGFRLSDSLIVTVANSFFLVFTIAAFPAYISHVLL